LEIRILPENFARNKIERVEAAQLSYSAAFPTIGTFNKHLSLLAALPVRSNARFF
jgi:hypothetical protein